MRKVLGWVASVALLAVLAAGQLPEPPYKAQFPGDPAHSQAEAAALGYMRTAVMAQRLYFKKHGQYATTLGQLVGHGSFTKRMANPDRGDYHVTFHGTAEHYSLQLTPRQFAPDHRAFYVDQTGIYHVEDDKAASAGSPKLTAER